MKVIGGDIGGTHSRLELFESVDGHLAGLVSEKYNNLDFGDFDELLADFLARHRLGEVDALGLAVAGPVERGECRLTNLNWRLSESQLKSRFELPRSHLLNDFAAIPYGIDELTEEDLVILQGGEPEAGGVRSFVGAGTGLGQSVSLQVGESMQVLSTEAGHADFAPGSRQQLEIVAALRDHGPVSNEMLLSGSGLVNIYSALKALGETEGESPPDLASADAPMQISERARAGDRLAARTVACFFEMLGSYVGNLALQTLPRGGLYLAGGIVPKLLDLMDREAFLHAYTNKARMRHLLQAIPLILILNEGVARLGAARSAMGSFD